MNKQQTPSDLSESLHFHVLQQAQDLIIGCDWPIVCRWCFVTTKGQGLSFQLTSERVPWVPSSRHFARPWLIGMALKVAVDTVDAQTWNILNLATNMATISQTCLCALVPCKTRFCASLSDLSPIALPGSLKTVTVHPKQMGFIAQNVCVFLGTSPSAGASVHHSLWRCWQNTKRRATCLEGIGSK